MSCGCVGCTALYESVRRGSTPRRDTWRNKMKLWRRFWRFFTNPGYCIILHGDRGPMAKKSFKMNCPECDSSDVMRVPPHPPQTGWTYFDCIECGCEYKVQDR